MNECINNIDININLSINDLFANIKNSKRQKEHENTHTNSQNTTRNITTSQQQTQQSQQQQPVHMNTEESILYVRCTGCNSDKLSEIDGYNICDECGLYNDCIIDSGQEWRYYGSEDTKGGDPARCDMVTNDLLPKTSFGSLIGFGSKETYTTKRIRNMNYWNKVPYRESSLMETYNNITIMAQNVGISQCIIEDAKYMYKKVSDLKSSRRTKKEGMKAGSIALACKKNGVPRNSNEIAKIFKQKNTKTFRKSIKTFEEIWNNIQMMENCNKSYVRTNIEPTVETNENDLDSDLCDDLDSNANSDAECDSDLQNNDFYNNEVANDAMDCDGEFENINANDKQIKPNKPNKPSNISATEIIPIDEADFMSDDDECGDMNNYSINHNSKKHQDSKNQIQSALHKHKNTPQRDYDSVKYLHRFCSILGLDDRVYEICKNILIKIEVEKHLERHNPLSRTASVIYYVVEKLDLKINKFSIVQTCEISDVTITKCYHKIAKYKNLFTQFFEMYE